MKRLYGVYGRDRDGFFEAQPFCYKSSEDAMRWIKNQQSTQKFGVQFMDFPEVEDERMFGPRPGKAPGDLILEGPIAPFNRAIG